MAINVPVPITPFWAWNRLESRPRQQDFSKVLKAEIHDPLWMMGRQWQMGEFTGMDSGSGVLARLQADYQMIDGIDRYNNHAPTTYATDMPLEPIIEAVSYNWSLKERILMGKKLTRFVGRALSPSDLNLFVSWMTASIFPSGFLLGVSEPTPSPPDNNIISGAAIYSDENVKNFLSGINLSALAIDGGVAFEILNSGLSLTSIIATSPTFSYASIVTELDNFVAWVKKMYVIQPNNDENWTPSHLEYQFDTYWPNTASATGQVRLPVKSYNGGHLDWHAFTQDNFAPAVSLPSAAPTTYSRQMIMSQSNFPGMPSSRWWEFEDGDVNFCNLDADPTDMAKIILTQFALIYQADWFLVPCKLPAGSYSDVKGVVVKDVFGVSTFINNYSVTGYSATGGFVEAVDEWKKWRWLDINTKTDVINSARPIGNLILPTVTKGTIESKPIESVMFVRDEIADLVWGIEKIVPDNLGKGKDGYDSVNKFVDYLRELRGSNDDIIPSPPIDADVKLSFQLQPNPIPENWIPLMPIHTSSPPSNRDIQFQRAAMPRILDKYSNSLVRPRTEILNYGLNSISVASPPISPDFSNRKMYVQSYGMPPLSYAPLYIHEEEVTKAGTIVQTKFKRTRWYNGKVVSWIGRQKMTGRGEGNSGLSYDSIKPVNS